MTPPLDIHWKETPLELLRLCSDEQDPEVERRLHALWLLSVGRSVEEVADYEEVHPGAVQQWLAWYRHGGLAEVRRGGLGRPDILTGEHLQILRAKLSGGTLRTAQEVQDTPPLDIDWKETPTEMFRIAVSEPDPELQIRFRTFRWLMSDKGVEEVSEIMEIDPRAVEQRLAWYRKGGLAEVRRHRRGGRGRPALLTEEQQKILRDKLSTGTLRSAREVMDWVYEVFGIKYTRAGMKTLLQRMAQLERDSTGG